MEFEGSDHRPVITYVDPTRNKVGRLSRYDRRLSSNPDIKNLITETWNSIPHLSVERRLEQETLRKQQTTHREAESGPGSGYVG